MKNLIILTHGWSGSSVFATLLGRNGFWLGEETVLKPDYDTSENARLVTLNNELLSRLAPDLDNKYHFDPADVTTIASRATDDDVRMCREFVRDCDARAPWLWKDPRLTWTIRVWARALALDDVAFLVLTRDLSQAWITTNLRRHIQSVRFTREYNDGVTQCNLAFLREAKAAHLVLSFEDLLLQPDRTLSRLNQSFGTHLNRADLAAVCRLPLGRKSRGWKDWLQAGLIYAKNFGERDGRQTQSPPAVRRITS